MALDSNGNPHVAFIHWNPAQDSFGRPDMTTRLDYAVWTGDRWDIQTVDSFTSIEATLKLDAHDTPHIIYNTYFQEQQSFLKYAVKEGQTWNIQTIDSTKGWMSYSMALDSSGNPHVVYTDTQDIKYAYFNDGKWIIQTIDRVNSSVGFNELSMALDSNDNPHIIYLESTMFPYPSQTVGRYSYLDSYNIKYACLSNNSWQSQTVFINSTNLGNLVLNSEGYPRFCYEYDVYSVSIEYGSYWVNSTDNYGYWDGQKWVSTPIPAYFRSGENLLNLDSNGNPQEFYYFGGIGSNQNSNKTGIIYSHWTGSNWEIYNIGMPINSTNMNLVDLAIKSNGLPVFIADEPVGSIGSAEVRGDLTYATLDALPSVPNATSEALPSAPDNNWLILPSVIAVIVIVLIIVSIVFKRKKAHRANPK